MLVQKPIEPLPAALAAVVAHLRCPLCAGSLGPDGGRGLALVCGRGHSFDVARRGCLNLLAGRRAPGGDTPAMVQARVDVLAAGHLDLVTRALAEGVAAAPAYPSGLIVDVGAGPGHHVSTVLDLLPGRAGLALDSSTAAARRAARAHPRAAAVVCDAWRGLPLADGCAALLVNVFAPRNGAEFRRVLHPRGTLFVVTPEPEHLQELIAALGLLRVDPDKQRRLELTLGRWFRLEDSRAYVASLRLPRGAVAQFVAMGPSAWHTDEAGLRQRLAALAEPLPVTASVRLHRYRPLP